ncbi:MAG TPA: ABC transporter permease [Anaerolineaceae bacterium]|nr:ABC transporter permease [Anaerolineaceae bacterium]
MGKYAIRRILQMIPLLIGISLVLFLVIQAAPGGPEQMMLQSGLTIDPAVIEAYRHRLGVDQPIYIQYFKWISSAVTGDLGISFATTRPVAETIVERLPATFELMAVSFLLAALIAIPMGIYSALHQYSPFDLFATTGAFLGIAMPVFWFGLILQLIFSVKLGWLPVAGTETVGATSFIDHIKHLILPSIVLSLHYIAVWSRYMRSSMLAVIRSDFIRTAHAKGLRERIVVFRHAVKNALIPVITIMALNLAALFSGAVITETIFAWPGIGRLFIQSMNSRDYPILMGILMMGSFMVVLFNLLADLVYGWLDPRISYQ